MTSPVAAGALDVDPEGLAAAGQAVTKEGDALVSALDTLMSALSSGAQAGHDAAGANFAFAYLKNGQAALSAAEAAVNACRNVGFGIGMSAANYSRAEAASTPGGGGSPPLLAPPPVMTVNVGAMPSPLGPGIAEPVLWTVVEAFVGGLWPDGEPDQLRAAAAAWETFGRAISSGSAEIERSFGTMVYHTIPERDAMLAALRTMIDDFVGIGSQCDVIGGQLRAFADEVQTVQQAVRDILHRLSPSGLFSGVMDVLRGDNPLDGIKKAARDIDTVLNNMKRESDAASEGLKLGIGVLDEIVNNAEPLIRKEFIDWFGEDVGNPLATAVNDVIDVTYGLGKNAALTPDGLRQSLRTLITDPQQFAEGLFKVAGALTPGYASMQELTDPEGARQTREIQKALIHYDDWNSDHPLRGLGANVFDVGTLFLGGGAGAAGKGGATAARAEGEAAAAAARGAVKDGASVASHAASSTEVAARSGKLADELNAIKPPETHGPTAQPGPSALPESRPPIDNVPSAPGGHDTPGVHENPTSSHGGQPAPNVNEVPAPHSPVAPAMEGHDYSFSPKHALENLQSSMDEAARLHEGGVPAKVTDGYNPLAGRTVEGFEREFTVPGRDGSPQWDWGRQAPNNGFLEDPIVTKNIPEGYQLDRLGSNGGGFMADDGAPLATRAMPPGVADQYHQFVGTGKQIPDGLNWEVQHGPAKSAFGQPGGANQWTVIDLTTDEPVSVDHLLRKGLIRETTER